MKKQFSLLLFLIIGVLGFAQECGTLMTPLSIQERSNEATHIIEGKVMASNSYWDIKKHNIYTVHTITTYKNFKGQSNASFKVVTMGGKIDNYMQVTSSSAQLQPGIEGTFFMKNFRGQLAVAERLYELVGAAQGVVKYDKYSDKASDTFSKYASLDSELYPSIRRATGYTEQILQARPLQNRTMAMRANPIIYSFSPLTATAGTQTVLTITGNNFGSTMGTMSFSNANDGGTSYTPAADAEILSWSNTQIEVEIPYLAGTGTLQITHNDGSTHETTVPLTIQYSHNNLDNSGTILPLALLDMNGNGGYTFAYHTDFNSSSAKTYFEEAFGLWNCESNINFSFGSTSTVDESISDGINIVRFDNGSELASGVLGVVTTRFTSYCPVTNRVNVDEMDITWNDSTNWHYGSGSPSASQYDFKTAALHELGHAHQLGHVIDSDVVMHYNLGAGDEKYVLDQDDIDGAVYTMGIFTQTTGCGDPAMSEFLDCCDAITINSSPQDSNAGEGDTVQFTASASDYESVQWYVSTNGGTSYSALSNDSNYSGTSSTTLTISNAPASFDGYMYAAYFTNVCSDTEASNAVTLTIVAYTSIPDSNFEAALETLGYDDISGDGQVPTDNINTVTSLNIDGENISDLTGLESFTALESLDADNNSLSSIDVSALSNLSTLRLDYNNLTDIDITNNTNLEVLSFRNNTLIDIDVSNNLDLRTLHFQFNDVATLDLTNNTALVSLICRGNDLTSLDLSQNTALTNVWAGDNFITNMDLSNNTLLTVVHLYNNELISLDLRNGNNSIISNFSLVNNENLSCILVSDLAFAEANWTNIPTNTSFTESNYCSYTSVPDANFEAALEALGYDDISGDGQVPTALIENVTSLQIGENSISDVTGLEDFAALTDLEFYQIGLSSIDLSNNILLQKVNLDNNPLTSIDLSALSNLTELSLELTDITSIDVTANTALVVLDVSDNDLLNTLDVRNGNNTNFSSFDATNNTSLTCIFVDDASYSTTNWTNIDSGTGFTETDYCRYTAIPDANFEAALEGLGYDDISSDGQVPTALIEVVTSLDVRNLNISDLTGIEDFVALEALYCSDNNLTTVNTSTLTNLQTFWALANNLTSVDLTNNLAITDIRIEQNNLTSIDLSNQTNLVILQIDRNELTAIDVSNSPLITRFRVYNNNISNIDLSNNTSLSEVRVSNNVLISLNVQNGNNTNIGTFAADQNEFLDCILVDDASYSTTNWTSIDAQTSFNDTECTIAYTAIPDSNFEAQLESLGYDDISGDGQVPTAIIESVTTLNVSNSSITDLTGIEDFTALTSLSVYDNNLGVIDISSNVNLETLDCQFTGLSTLDVSANTALTNLYANGNSITSIDLTNNTELIQLGMYSNGLVTVDVSNNTKLITIDLFQNQLTSIDLSNNLLLEDLLLENNNLTSLDLSTNTALKNITCNTNNLDYLDVRNGANTSIVSFNATNNTSLTCIQVDDALYSTTNWTNVDNQTTFSETACTTDFTLGIDVFLQGALLNPNTGEENLMRDDLRVAGFIPTTSPYVDALTCEATVFDTTGNDAIVDWILIEFRDATDNTIVTYSQSALLQRDGDVVDVDGISDIAFSFDGEADFYLGLQHRNHLGIMTSSSIPFVNNALTTINFTDATNQFTYGTAAQTDNGMPTDTVAMWCGDVNGDSIIQYSGTDPDVPAILSEILNDSGNFLNFPTYAITGYNDNDIDMNGTIQYSGTDPDTPFILQNVLAHPSNFFGFSTYQILGQTPENTSN